MFNQTQIVQIRFFSFYYIIIGVIKIEDIYADLNKRMVGYVNRGVKEQVNSQRVAPQSSVPASKPLHKSIKMNTMVTWELPCKLCPSCMALLNGAEPKMVSGWTNPAKESFMKKTYGKKFKKAKKSTKKAVVEEPENY